MIAEWFELQTTNMAKDHQISPLALGLPFENMNEVDDDIPEGYLAELITKQIRKTNIAILRGDTISLVPQEEKYRNDFTQIYDGDNVIDLEWDLDDQGHIPRQFVVTNEEYTPDYWKDVIAHNGIFHLDRSIQDTMKFQIMGSSEVRIAQADVQIGNRLWSCQQDDISNWKDEKPAYEDIQFSVDTGEFPGLDDQHMNSFFLFHKTDWQKRNDE